MKILMFIGTWRLRVIIFVGVAAVNNFAVAAPPLDSLRPGEIISWEQETEFLPTLDAFSAAYRIIYRSTGQLGGAVAVSGMVFVPKGVAPSGGWPIVAWDHGTSGVGDECAPSRWPDMYDNGSWDIYADQIDNLLREKYLVVASDYEGLGTPGLNTYLQTKSLAQSTIDGVRAARNLISSSSSRWAVIGHSAGGQAAIGAGELAASYGKGLSYIGAVALAPAQHLEVHVERFATSKFGAPYLAYMAVGMRAIDPNFDYSRFVGPLFTSRMSSAEEHCWDEWFVNENRGTQPTLETSLNPNWASDSTVQQWLINSQVGQRKGAAPMLVLQGSGDLLLFPTYLQFLGDLCASGNVVHSIVYNQVGHDHVIITGWDDARAWLAARFRGDPAPNDCR